MKKEKKFCKYCGSPLGLYFTGYFDEYTGQKEQQMNCTNWECSEHCGVVIEHHWGKVYLFQNWEKCQRCGYVICDY